MGGGRGAHRKRAHCLSAPSMLHEGLTSCSTTITIISARSEKFERSPGTSWKQSWLTSYHISPA